jgi:hypothetical protein
MSSKIYKKCIPLDVIENIKKFYDTEPPVNTEHGIVNKNLEYHIPDNFIYKTLNPYLNQILGENHEFSTGAYKASQRPYIIHVDSPLQFEAYGCTSFDTGELNQNKAVLIPLVEGFEFRTIVFQGWSDFNPTREELEKQKTDQLNQLDPRDFGHERMFDVINYLPIDIDYQWSLGDMFVWDRDQWHMSSDFIQYNKTKIFLILFV